MGEGEYTSLELLSILKSKGDPTSVQGLCFLRDNKMVDTGERPCHSLDDLPYFNMDLVNYPRYQHRMVFRGQETTPVNWGIILTGVGCPYRCTFCINSNKHLSLGKYRTKSPKRIADEIEFLMTQYNINYFDFSDENFFINRRNVERFVEEVTHRKLRFGWYTNMRADAFDRKIADLDLMKRLQGIGCHRLAVGAESGSQRILDKLKKDITLAQIHQSADFITQSGMGVSYSFMMGVPGETPEETWATLDMIRSLKSRSRLISIIGPQVFRPYPGGALYDECLAQYGYQEPQSLEEWSTSINRLTGYDSIDRLPWIKDPELIKRVSFYIDFSNMNVGALPQGILKKAFLYLMKALADLRIRYRVLVFNFEMDLIMSWKSFRRA